MSNSNAAVLRHAIHGTVLLAAVAAAGNAHAAFAPSLQWSWTSSAVAPTSLNVMSTPSVIDLNRDGTPDVVFGSTASTGGGLVETGLLRALDGRTGAELFSVTDASLAINAVSSVATGDIDADGRIDIIASDDTGARLLAFNDDGTFKWRSPVLEAVNWGAPAIADLDADGQAEVVIGRQVLSSSGALAWTGTSGRGSGSGAGPLSVVSDIDLDGHPDVIAGNTVYSATGAIEAQNAALPDGYTAIGNFDADAQGEVVLVASGQVWILDTNMSVISGPVAIPGGGYGGAPTVADFDGDGAAEIGVAGANHYAVIEGNGALKWSVTTQDISSNRTGSSVFDFEHDGSAEVVYGDELFLRVYDGDDGSVLFQTPRSSCTWYEYPVVADVDGLGGAEIVVTANNNCGYGPQQGVFVYGDDAWVDTRPIWNEHSYHITNVALDGTIPAHEAANWLTAGLNNFRLNEYLPGENPVPAPGSAWMVSLGAAALAFLRRRRAVLR